MLGSVVQTAWADGGAAADEIVVTVSKAQTPILDIAGNTARISGERIRITNPAHIHELGNQAAGVWLTRGSGQETLPAIRSPVLTGPGACGAFLVLENGIPMRPTGFCNINQMFELPTELGRSVEMIRGPSNALYGSNGLHGTINILLPDPGSDPGWGAGVTIGPDNFYRARLDWDGTAARNGVAAGGLVDHYDGFRDATGYRQQKGYVRLDRAIDNGTVELTLSAQNLEQDTGGFIIGRDTYKDRAIRTTNPNPEAFRDADSQRLSLRWRPTERTDGITPDLRLYLRRSDMTFLQHFIPGQPREDNGQVSGGMMLTLQRAWPAIELTAGLDAEVMDAFIRQFQAAPLNGDSTFLNATLPAGQHYDFDVDSIMAAPYAQVTVPVGASLKVIAGLRVEYLRYDYDNRMLAGNTRDDGTACGFGGCRYNRPADRSDSFTNAAPNIGLLYRLDAVSTLYATLARGFRAPQATEMYRLQNGQTVADLDSVELDSLEIGIHRITDRYRVEATAFSMHKRNDIFQDTDRNNISNGKSRHIGIELQADWRTATGFYAGIAGTWARHRYDFTTAARGETIVSGNDIDTAPRTLGSLRLGWDRGRGRVELEGVHQGAYKLDAANDHRYGGHDLLNLRAQWRIDDAWQLTGRINNLTDRLYADRADYAFGDYRYFPGRTREFFLDIAYRH